MPCSCANTDLHLVSVRKTFDDKKVELWSDGVVLLGSGKFGFAFSRKIGMEAGWLVMGEVSLYTSDELTRLCKAAKQAVNDKTTRLGETALVRMRRRMA